jgi:hypothetical protein
VETLSDEQRVAMRHALFFLRRPLSPQFAPGYVSELFGTTWNDGDFSTITRAVADADGPLDPGGLWRMDGDDVTLEIRDLRLRALVAVALSHDGLCGAIDAFRGRREPTDLAPACDP